MTEATTRSTLFMLDARRRRCSPWRRGSSTRRPTSRRWAWSRRSIYFHVPSAWMFLVAAIVCGVASARFLFFKQAGAPIAGRCRGRARPAVRPVDAGDRAAVGPQGVGRLVGVGRAADVEPAAVPDLRRPTCCCGSTAGRVGKARRRHGAVRHGQRAVHLRVGQHLADASIRRPGRADAADRDGRSRCGSASPRSCCCSWRC